MTKGIPTKAFTWRLIVGNYSTVYDSAPVTWHVAGWLSLRLFEWWHTKEVQFKQGTITGQSTIEHHRTSQSIPGHQTSSQLHRQYWHQKWKTKRQDPKTAEETKRPDQARLTLQAYSRAAVIHLNGVQAVGHREFGRRTPHDSSFYAILSWMPLRAGRWLSFGSSLALLESLLKTESFCLPRRRW